jgi:hypothetical protein
MTATYENQTPALNIDWTWYWELPAEVVDRTDAAFWAWWMRDGPRNLDPLADAHTALVVGFTGGFPDEVFA